VGTDDITLIADRTWRLTTAAGHRSSHTTQCYLLLDDADRVHVVDPGEATPSNLRLIAAAVEAIGGVADDVATILVTHYHHDHLGGADALRVATGGRLALHEVEQAGIRYSSTRPSDDSQLERWGVPGPLRYDLLAAWHWIPPLRADIVLHDGELLDSPGRTLRALWTPGHTEGHLCLIDEDQGLLFSGDHVLPDVTPGVGERIALPGNPIDSYLDSLASTARLDVALVLPGHGEVFAGLAERCDQIADRHRRRTTDVASALHAGAESVWDVASSLPWTGGWHAMPDSVRRSALHQVELHMQLLEASGR